MIVLMMTAAAVVVSYLVWSVCVEQVARRDRRVFAEAYRNHGGTKQVWAGTDWEAIARWQRKRQDEHQEFV